MLTHTHTHTAKEKQLPRKPVLCVKTSPRRAVRVCEYVCQCVRACGLMSHELY